MIWLVSLLLLTFVLRLSIVGKSTLLNYILKSDHGKRIAIIENEFSEGLGIETMIAKSGVDGNNITNFFELPNGCVCSTKIHRITNRIIFSYFL